MEDTESRLKKVIKGLNSTNGRFQTDSIREAAKLKETITPLLLSMPIRLTPNVPGC